ncbi:putative RNA-directed DNA polymerase [Tanacetum coccineum]
MLLLVKCEMKLMGMYPRHIDGLKLSKPNPKFVQNVKSNLHTNKKPNAKNDEVDSIKITNNFSILQDDDTVFATQEVPETSTKNDDTYMALRMSLKKSKKHLLNRDAANSELMDEEASLRATLNHVPNVFVSHYMDFLGSDMMCDELDSDDLVLGMTKGYVWYLDDKANIILTNRIIEGIKEVVSENQSAFVPGRRISDNILITQELMHNYHLDRGPPSINGDIHGYFKRKRGLRQGDPLSPYLFTLVMEILTLILQRRVRLSDSFRYHKHCEDLNIINVCFADDLFLFARGDVVSASVIMDSLNELKAVSGLVPSIRKSTAFFCNVLNHVKIGILNVMPFSEGKLPVKYLGVPLISSRLLNKDCKILVEKARNRIGDWKNKSLSFAGRLQLCKSVISSMQVYWASVLVLPKGIIYDIQQLIRCFLWCNGDFKRGKAKVAWEDICLPKQEGGLGIRSLELRGRTLWDIQPKSDMSWGWRKILQLRDTVKPFLWVRIGNGMSTSLWYDMWCSQSPISRFLSPRDITREGFTIQSKVADLVTNGTWNWPLSWLAKAPNLALIAAPILVNSHDCIQWRDMNGNMAEFSVKLAWEALRPRGAEVLWYKTVWFAHCIPRHAFHLWLVMRRSLKTQDKLRPWDVGPSIDLNTLRCVFCQHHMDSHEHLFFECSYASKVWNLVRIYAEMDTVRPLLYEITGWFQTMAHKRTVHVIVGKLIFAAASYFIWCERNNRLFKGTRRSPEEIRDLIIVTVRLKLVSFRFKNTSRVTRLLALWKMPSNFRLYGD